MTKKRTRDLVEKIEELDIDFDPGVFLLQNVMDERVPLNVRMDYARDLLPYYYAKKKDVQVDANHSGDLKISWVLTPEVEDN